MSIIRTTRSSKRTSQSQPAHQPQPLPSSKPPPDSPGTRQPSPSSDPPAKKPRTSVPKRSTRASHLAVTHQVTQTAISPFPSSAGCCTPPSTSNPTSSASTTLTLDVSEASAHPVPPPNISCTPTPSTATIASSDASSPLPLPPTSTTSSFAPTNSATMFNATSAPAIPPTRTTSVFISNTPPNTVQTQRSSQIPSGTTASNAVHTDASSLASHPPPAPASIPASTSATSLPDEASSKTEPDDLVQKPRTTAHLVCPSSEIEQASIVRLDPWVPIDVVDRIYKLCDYTDLCSTSFSIVNIPSSATWGSKYACMDRSTYLCIDNEPIVAWLTGAVAKKWFSDYQGQPQSPVKLAVNPARSIDLAAAHYWLGRGTGSKAPTSDAVWASKLMLEWSADPDVEKPDVIPFMNIFDATDRFSCQDELAQKTPRFFRVGDIVLMEFHITRYKPKGSKTTTWNSFQVGFELVAIDIIARNPQIVNAADATSHSPIKRRMVNI